MEILFSQVMICMCRDFNVTAMRAYQTSIATATFFYISNTGGADTQEARERQKSLYPI